MTLIQFKKFDESRPIYLQVIEAIKKAIIRGELKPGDKIPSVRELAQELRINPNTVQKAYQELEREGITFTRRGQGNFVTEDQDKITSLKQEILEKIVRDFINELDSVNLNLEDIMDKIKEYMENEGHSSRKFR